MNNYIIVFFILILISCKTFGSPQQIDKIIAIVNNEVILESELNKIINTSKITMKNINQKDYNLYILRSQILDKLIKERIILQKAKQMQINILQEEIDSIIKRLFNKNSIINKKQNDLNKYTEEIRKEILIYKTQTDAVKHKIIISPKEVDTVIKQIIFKKNNKIKLDIDHILISFSKKTDKKRLNTILLKNILNKLKNNIDLNKLRIIFYKNPNVLKIKKINLLELEKLPIKILEKIKKAKNGEIIGPIFSNAGYSIFRINNIFFVDKNIFVTEAKVRHILIKVSPIINDEQVKEKLFKISNEILNGNISFSNAAEKYSEDLNTSSKGGELGWNMIEIYHPKFFDILIKLKKGELSKPINTNIGWHLIQLEDIRSINKTKFVNYEEAYNILFNRKLNDEVENWIQEQVSTSYIKIFNNFI
ncbi:peptidylprolyl isomerase [Candidatus Providencia siddallii]|uniref:Chaperone SurA n=1 Tax=Candidatus Providencia siddallii TaxID=1715285 RepID=A0ABP1CDY4_9GAMM